MHACIVIYTTLVGKSFFNYHGLNMHRLRVFRSTLTKLIPSVIIFIATLYPAQAFSLQQLVSSCLALYSERKSHESKMQSGKSFWYFIRYNKASVASSPTASMSVHLCIFCILH